MTTIVSVRRNNQVVIAGDGQVSLGNTVMKGNAKKVRRLYNNKVLAGFAGGTADAFTLFERFESKLEIHQGNLTRAAVELAKDWRSDRMLRKLEAILAVADETASFIITGNGDVVQPENDIIAIGSGGNFAQSSAMALLENKSMATRTNQELCFRGRTPNLKCDRDECISPRLLVYFKSVAITRERFEQTVCRRFQKTSVPPELSGEYP